jgi:hypothetical protein
MKFRSGEPRPARAGRRAGTPNKRTREIAAVLQAAANEVGGEARLVEWIKASEANERDFWCCMFIKLLPMQVQGTGERGEIEMSMSVKLTPEEVARKMEELGLPASHARPPPPPPGDPTLN